MAKQDPRRVLGDVGRRVAELRVARGMTQEELAERVLECSTKYLQRLEAGRENLTIESLVALANRLRVKVQALFDPPASRLVRRGRPRKIAD